MDETWEKLIQEFLEKMRRVDCDAETFREGLRYAQEEITTEIEASRQSS